MKKLGFKIIRFRQGPQTLLSVNGGEWERKVVDIGDTLKIFSSEDMDKFAMFMSFSEKGTYLTIAKFIPGRLGEYIAAWIYVPNDLDVTGEQLVILIEQIKQSLLSNRIEGLEELFFKEYNSTVAASFVPSSNERQYAFRNTTFFALKNIIGPNRYQSYYSPFSAIILIGDDSMKIEIDSIVDLSQHPLMESLVFCPPEKNDVPEGVTVHFNQTGFPLFNKPVRVGKGDKVDILFVRDGFDNIAYSETVRENEQICETPHKREWFVTISSAYFKVYAAKDGKDITNVAKIRINGKEVKYNSSIRLRESEAKQALLSVSAPDYQIEEETVNFLSRKNHTFYLHRSEREQSWNIELKNGDSGIMTIRSKSLPIEKYDSPIKGYSVLERNTLTYTQSDKWKQRFIGFVVAVIIWLIILFIGWWRSIEFRFDSTIPFIHYDYIEDLKNNSPKPSYLIEENLSQQKPEEKPEDPYNLEAAIDYLDSNEVWKRDDMLNYEALNGLFDFINTYDFDSILDQEEKLKASKTFMKLIQAIKDNKYKSFRGTYTPDADLTITISRYIDKLNKYENSGTESRSSVISPEGTKKNNSQTKGNRGNSESNSSSNNDKTKQRGGV